MASMVSICWLDSEAIVWVKVLKFIALTGANLVAVTNLAICINLALIVSSHRNMTRVRSMTGLEMLGLLLLSAAAALAAVPYWGSMVLSGTLYWPANNNPAHDDWVSASTFFVELTTGVLMFLIMGAFLTFRLPALRDCWKIDRRIRFYFCLTVIAIVANLSVGVGGLLNLTWKWNTMHMVVGWGMRNVHIALDTLVLYGALGVTSPGGGVGGSTSASRGGSAEVVVAMFSEHERASHLIALSADHAPNAVASW